MSVTPRSETIASSKALDLLAASPNEGLGREGKRVPAPESVQCARREAAVWNS